MSAQIHRFGTPPLVIEKGGRVIGVVLDFEPKLYHGVPWAQVCWESDPEVFNRYQWLPLAEVFR